MLTSQRLQIRHVELASELNSSEMLKDKPEHREKRQELEKAIKQNSVELTAALKTEGRDIDEEEREYHASGTGKGSCPESRELRRMIDKAGDDFGQGFDAIINGRHPQGAFAELQAERGLPSHMLPLDLLREDRAVTTGLTDSEGQAGRYRPYAYPGQIANFLGFETPRVAYGTPTYPIITTPASVHLPAKSVMAAESSVVVAADALIPSRVTGSLRYAVEDAARFAQMSEFLRRHMREAVGSAIDTRVLTDSTNGLGSISEPNDPAAVSDYDTYVGSVTGRVDGRRAAVPAEVRLVVGGMTFAHMAGQYRTTASESSAYDRLRLISGGVRVHSDIPAPSSNDQEAYSVAGPANLPGVAPMWDGIGLMVDSITDINKGEVIVHFVALSAVKILDTGAFVRHRFQIA